MRRLLFLTTILACEFILNSCNNTKQLTSQTEALFRNKWKLMEVVGQQVPDSLNSIFEFTPGKISGTGCNWIWLLAEHQTVTPDAPIKWNAGMKMRLNWNQIFGRLIKINKMGYYEVCYGLGMETILIKLRSL
jgi:hypothetical protein